MPNANIQRSVDRGSGKLGGEQIQEVLYEGYGPGGVAILVELLPITLTERFQIFVWLFPNTVVIWQKKVL